MRSPQDLTICNATKKKKNLKENIFSAQAQCTVNCKLHHTQRFLLSIWELRTTEHHIASLARMAHSQTILAIAIILNGKSMHATVIVPVQLRVLRTAYNLNKIEISKNWLRIAIGKKIKRNQRDFL